MIEEEESPFPLTNAIQPILSRRSPRTVRLRLATSTLLHDDPSSVSDLVGVTQLSGREFWDMDAAAIFDGPVHTAVVTVSNSRQARAVVYKTGRISGASVDYSDMVNALPSNIRGPPLGQLFDVLDEDEGIFWRTLDSLQLRPEKTTSAISSSAGLYLWLAAHGADIPLHKPIQLQSEETGVIAEGSSTYKCLCTHFDGNVLVPCTLKDVIHSTPEERLLFAAWKGQTDRVRQLLQAGASPFHMFPRYTCTALSKSEQLGYTDIANLLATPLRTPNVNDCGCGFNFMFNTVQGLGLTGSTHGHINHGPVGACGGNFASGAAASENAHVLN